MKLKGSLDAIGPILGKYIWVWGR